MEESKLKDKRVCRVCDLDTTWTRIAKNGAIYAQWHSDGFGSYLCNRCYNRLIGSRDYRRRHPEKVRMTNKRWFDRTIMYKGKSVAVKENPRKGICSLCGKSIATKEIRITHMHHYGEYIDSDPLANTIELCNSCHGKESWKLGQIFLNRQT